MKKKIIIAALTLVMSGIDVVSAQTNQIPAEVNRNFTAKFPQANNIEWNDEPGNYKVTFNENGKNYRVEFAGNGDWKLTERIIKKDYLPTSVSKNFFKSEYSKWEIKEVTVVETPENKIQFKISVTKNSASKKDLLYNTEGQLLTANSTL